MILRANVICLLGAAIGLAALLLPWNSQTIDDSTWEYEMDEYSSDFLQHSTDDWVLMSLGAYAFIAGTALAFWSPLGGMAQGTGQLLLYLAVFVVRPTSASVTRSPELGFYLGIVSVAVVVASMVMPVFLGTKRGADAEDPRFVAWNVKRGHDRQART